APELPGVRLLTGELGAVDPRLLASTDADHLTAYRIADGVRLRVLQGRVTEHQIAPRCLAQRTDHDIVQIVESEDPVVARLRQPHPENLARLALGRREAGVRLQHDERALLLAGQRGERT